MDTIYLMITVRKELKTIRKATGRWVLLFKRVFSTRVFARHQSSESQCRPTSDEACIARLVRTVSQATTPDAYSLGQVIIKL